MHGPQTGGFYACNTFDNLKTHYEGFSTKKINLSEQEFRELLRYEFNYTRFLTHQSSKNNALMKKEEISKQILALFDKKDEYKIWS